MILGSEVSACFRTGTACDDLGGAVIECLGSKMQDELQFCSLSCLGSKSRAQVLGFRVKAYL